MHLSGKRIFIVDDNLANSTIMKVILEASGAKVYFDRLCTNVPARMREVMPIDIVVMDLMLANGLSGYDVFDRLQTDPQLCHIPAIVVSASDMTIEMHKVHQHGFAGYISKPINKYTFAQNIAAVLKGRAIWGEED